MTTDDTWFRPVDIKLGPDGALYIADWYDGQCNHYRNHEGEIDKSTGRIYRLKAKGQVPAATGDLARLPGAELVRLLRHDNKWIRQTALRLIGDRRDETFIPMLRSLLDDQGQAALEALWGIHFCQGLDDGLVQSLLAHRNPYVRAWAVRLACDDREVSPSLAGELASHAACEEHVEVRCQMACSARRLPAASGLPIVMNLLRRDEDADDDYLPLLLWWAIEECVSRDPEAVLACLADPSLWDAPIVRRHIAERLMRRFALAVGRTELLACARLLQLAPSDEHRRLLLVGFENALAGRALPRLLDELAAAMERYGGGSVILGLRRGFPQALDEALRRIVDPTEDSSLRLQYVRILGEVHPPAAIGPLVRLATASGDSPLQSAAIAALESCSDPAIADALLAVYGSMADEAREATQSILVQRPRWTQRLLDEIAAGRIETASIPPDVVQRMRLVPDDDVAERVSQLWPAAPPGTPGDVQAEIIRLASVLRSGTGVPKRGREIFGNHCGKCHRLFGVGGQVGPDLTSANRADLAQMLLSIVRPSAEIREGFAQVLVTTSDGRSIVGVVAEQDPQRLTLSTVEGRGVVVARDDIDAFQPLPLSMMPDGLLQDYSDQDVRDLFAYLRSTQPLID